MDQDIKTKFASFLEQYLHDEYEAWKAIHTIKDSAKVDTLVSDFEGKYLSEGMYSDISRPNDFTAGEFESFSDLLLEKSKRHIYCLKPLNGREAWAVLGSIYHSNDFKFELIKITEKDNLMRITSSYYTNFDNTFSYVNGENIGEIISDPCDDK